MRRRDFFTIVARAAVAWPFATQAQQSVKVYRIGVLGSADPGGYVAQIDALRLGLQDHGYVEGKNITIEYRWAEGKYDRLPALAAELVRLKVDVIITHGTPAALAAKQVTTTIPIVMAIVGNPVENGIVSSIARPGGNITGSSFFGPEINSKRLEIMKSLVPNLARAGVLMNPDNPATPLQVDVMGQTAQALRVTLQPVQVRRLDDLDAAFERARAQVEALTIMDEGLYAENARRIAELAKRNRLPSIGFSEYCEAGGLAGYGVDFPHVWRQSMVFVDKVLKGAKPAELPVQQAMRFEFVINLKVAKALGLSVPFSLLSSANKVIE
jgi:putative tryptophan/tyrosine transport system substrate-binding protein